MRVFLSFSFVTGLFLICQRKLFNNSTCLINLSTFIYLFFFLFRISYVPFFRNSFLSLICEAKTYLRVTKVYVSIPFYF